MQKAISSRLAEILRRFDIRPIGTITTRLLRVSQYVETQLYAIALSSSMIFSQA